ncbi:MAG: protein translocase subunit SecF, partial [Pseudomonadota bacterium]|nr:protein translocase subunit SecF [Pseudomonadota bacterium]
MRLKLVPSETKIDFLRLRMPALGFSSLLVAASIAMFAVIGLNLGIDFRGGILIEARNTEGPADIAGVRSDLGKLGLGDISLQGFGSETDVLVRVQRQDGDEAAQIAAIERITSTLGANYEIRRTEFVGPTVGAELAEKGVLAVVCAL